MVYLEATLELAFAVLDFVVFLEQLLFAQFLADCTASILEVVSLEPPFLEELFLQLLS